jgi:hypothetical protein
MNVTISSFDSKSSFDTVRFLPGMHAIHHSENGVAI